MHTVAQPLVQFGTFPESLLFILCVHLVQNPLKAFGKGDEKHEMCLDEPVLFMHDVFSYQD